MAEENKFLEIVDLKKGYGSGETRQEVLRGMTFSVARGEICVLLGPSASGKSTLLNIIGYENREIARLYLLSTTIVLVLIDAVSVWLGAAAMKLAWREIMFFYSGWFAFHMEPAGYVKMFVFVLLGYAIVTIFDFRRIRKIPMDEALKSAE